MNQCSKLEGHKLKRDRWRFRLHRWNVASFFRIAEPGQHSMLYHHLWASLNQHCAHAFLNVTDIYTNWNNGNDSFAAIFALFENCLMHLIERRSVTSLCTTRRLLHVTRILILPETVPIKVCRINAGHPQTIMNAAWACHLCITSKPPVPSPYA